MGWYILKFDIIKFRSFFLGLVSFLSFFAAVVPNSIPQITLAFLFASFLVSLVLSLRFWVDRRFLSFWIVGTIVTLFYSVVGIENGAPIEAVVQVLFIYILSPIFWFFVISAVLRFFDDKSIFQFFQFFLVLSALTVPLFFYLFTSYGPSSVEFFKKGANVNLKDGYAGATMHVYGTFIFFAGAFFSAPDLFESKFRQIILLCAIFIVAFTSGRSALMLAVLLGCFIYFLFPRSLGNSSHSGRLVNFFVLFFGVLFFTIIFSSQFDIDLLYIFDLFVSEVSSGGGGARSEQSSALAASVVEQYGLGAGHGVGVDYVRSFEHPWRYEVIWLATLHRVGLLGAIIYCLPFIYYTVSFARFALKGQIFPFDRFLFGGFVCVFLASTTNPYIEAFTFQWMYLFPVIHLLERKSPRGGVLRVS